MVSPVVGAAACAFSTSSDIFERQFNSVVEIEEKVACVREPGSNLSSHKVKCQIRIGILERSKWNESIQRAVL